MCLLNLPMSQDPKTIVNQSILFSTSNWQPTSFQNCKSMFKKLLKVHKLTPFQRPPKLAAAADQWEEEGFSTPLKIVHTGGMVECFYMATPAARIMEKYPSFVLARPQVFRQPWDSIVRPDEILHPGEKFFVVPRRTVRKLKRRIKKPSSENPEDPFSPQSSNDVSAGTRPRQKDESSRNVHNDNINTSVRANTKQSYFDKHERFATGVDMAQKKKCKEGENSRRSSNPESDHGRKRGIRNAVTWQPSLTSICESMGN
ncbi:hypothetical protein FH972_014206 [Carpinus fangiana]|uniref:Uncharacterized protein n=1 Tax=Carpinus fangiana TaxID=176857 RepID=A0A5N6RCJ5_9ROSI|nr:hypothetical protein FH972_014206 [Carpinus fangiana]